MGFGFGPIPNLVTSQTAAPTGTASGTLVMAGLALAMTPSVTGRVMIFASGCCATGTTNDGGQWQLSYGTGGAPTNGTAVTGTQVGGVQVLTNGIAGAAKYPFCQQVLVTTLTVGTAYWFDIAFGAITGGTFSLSSVQLTVWEM